MERKYSYEAGLGVYTFYKTIVGIEHLKRLGEVDSHQYHIYAILAYEQFYFRKEKVYCTDEGIKITLFTVKNGEETEYELPILPIPGIDANILNIELNMPYTSMILSIDDTEYLEKNPEYKEYREVIYAQDIFITFAQMLIEKMEFKVLYIGQSYDISES